MTALATVRMFWHGRALSRIERLSMASFLTHGHPVVLYAYNEPTGVPPGVTMADAALVLPRESVFRHARTGSLAVFADWFRYRVLRDSGGIWSDADVVCLRPISPERHELAAWQDDEMVCGAVLGLPAGHPVLDWMVDCCEHPTRILPYDPPGLVLRKLRRRLLGQRSPSVLGFGEVGPRGLTRALRHLNRLDLVQPSWTLYPLPFREWRRAFDGSVHLDSPELARSWTLHLWNEMMRREPGFDGNARHREGSLFEEACRRYLPGEPAV